MAVTRTENQDDGAREPATAATPDEAPTGQLLAGAVGDRCANCGAPLASDQRYCVQCGERRGKSRFSPASTPAQPTQTTTTTVTQPVEPPRRRGSSGATVVAGIATLVLALGVGVEIGRIANNGNSGSKAAAAPPVTVISPGGSGSSAQTTSTAGGSTAAPKVHHHSAPPPKTEAGKAKQAAAAPKPTQQAVQKASHAASGVLGGSAGQSNNTVTTGQSCAVASQITMPSGALSTSRRQASADQAFTAWCQGPG